MSGNLYTNAASLNTIPIQFVTQELDRLYSIVREGTSIQEDRDWAKKHIDTIYSLYFNMRIYIPEASTIMDEDIKSSRW